MAEGGSGEPVAQLSPARGEATIAYRAIPGGAPGIVFLPGYRSVMTGEKASALAAFARASGRAMVRFDYRGHGESEGRFEELVLSDWLDDVLSVLDRLTKGPQILVGSSMGGYLSLLAAVHRPHRVAGLVGIAAAADFTERLLTQLSAAERAALERAGVRREPSLYEEDGYPFTWKLFEDGRRHLLLDGPIRIAAPVRLLHGMQDADVPWAISLQIAERLTSNDVRLHLVKDGDHRLSRSADLRLLTQTVSALLDQLSRSIQTGT
jgi:pimeloyl-ACP methyl ester carboxylesterase